MDHPKQESGSQRDGGREYIGTPGVETAGGRDRTQSGELPADMGVESGGTTRPSTPGTASSGSGQSGTGTAGSWQSGTGTTGSGVNVGQVTEQVQERAGEVIDKAREQAVSRLDEQRGRMAESLSAMSQALRDSGQQLRERDQTGVAAQLVSRFADQTDRIATHLQHHDTSQLIDEAERFARSQPAVFLAGAFAIGFLAARFLRSSRPSTGTSGGGYGYSGGYGSPYPGYRGQTSGGYGTSGRPYAGAYSSGTERTGGYSGSPTGRTGSGSYPAADSPRTTGEPPSQGPGAPTI